MVPVDGLPQHYFMNIRPFTMECFFICYFGSHFSFFFLSTVHTTPLGPRISRHYMLHATKVSARSARFEMSHRGKIFANPHKVEQGERTVGTSWRECFSVHPQPSCSLKVQKYQVRTKTRTYIDGEHSSN